LYIANLFKHCGRGFDSRHFQFPFLEGFDPSGLMREYQEEFGEDGEEK